MRPSRTCRPSLSVGRRPSPGGRDASQWRSAGRSSRGASSSMRTSSSGSPRPRIVRHGSATSARRARSSGRAAPGSRTTRLRTTIIGCRPRCVAASPSAPISRPIDAPSRPSTIGIARSGGSASHNASSSASGTAHSSSTIRRQRQRRRARGGRAWRAGALTRGFRAAARRRRLRRRTRAGPRVARRCRRSGSGCRTRAPVRTPRRPWPCRRAW